MIDPLPAVSAGPVRQAINLSCWASTRARPRCDSAWKGGSTAGRGNCDFAFQLDHATTKNGFVPRLWASRKIAALVEDIRQAGADSSRRSPCNRARHDPRLKELVDEIVRLSVEFGILTEYTAFIDKQGTDLTARNAVLQQATAELRRSMPRTPGGHGRREPSHERQRVDFPVHAERPQRLLRSEHEPGAKPATCSKSATGPSSSAATPGSTAA